MIFNNDISNLLESSIVFFFLVKPLKVRLEYKITHKTSKAEDSGIIIKGVEIIMPPSTNTSKNVDRENLLKMLTHEGVVDPVHFRYIMPKFIKVTSGGTAEPVDVLMLEKPGKFY